MDKCLSKITELKVLELLEKHEKVLDRALDAARDKLLAGGSPAKAAVLDLRDQIIHQTVSRAGEVGDSMAVPLAELQRELRAQCVADLERTLRAREDDARAALGALCRGTPLADLVDLVHAVSSFAAHLESGKVRPQTENGLRVGTLYKARHRCSQATRSHGESALTS